MGWAGILPGRGVALFGKMPRRTSAPRVAGAIFFLSCVSVGAVPVADAGARTLEFSKLKYRQQLLCFFKEYLENFGTKIEISPAITLFFLGLAVVTIHALAKMLWKRERNLADKRTNTIKIELSIE